MSFGARPFGSRTFGDGTGSALVTVFALTATATTVHVSYHLPTATLTIPPLAATATTVHVSYHLPTATLVASGGAGVSVKVVDLAGVFYGRLNCTVDTAEWELNGMDRAQLRFSATDPTSALVLGRVGGANANDILGVLHRELEVWYAGRRILAGPCPVIDIDADGMCSGTIYGFPWWLFQRVVGRADRTNLIVNGGFETGSLSSWTTTGAPTVVTAPLHTGNFAARLVPADMISQTFTFSHTYGPGLEPRFAAPVYFPSTSSAPPGDQWFDIEASDAPGVKTPVAYSASTFARNTYQELTFGLGRVLAPNVNWTVTIRATGGTGGIYVDNLRCSQPESIGADYFGSDPAEVGRRLVERTQDPAYGKSALGIGTAVHATTAKSTTVWQDADHEEFGRALSQLVNTSPGIDWWATYNDRKIHFAASRGSLKPEYKLRSGQALGRFRVRVDGTQMRNSAIVIGVGADFTRDEGGHIVISTLPIMEMVEHAPVSMPVRDYDRWAQSIATARSRPLETVTVDATTWGLDMLGSIEPGDSVPVKVTVGEFPSERNHRILSLTADFDTGRLTPVLSAT